MADTEIDRLIYLFSKLPGIGPRSARRIVLHLIKNKNNLMLPLADSIFSTANSIKVCSQCANLDNTSPCNICVSEKRDKNIICVVESVADLWAMERNHVYNGLYHVLGGTLSAIDGRGPNDLNFDSLLNHLRNSKIEEVVIATNATVEGQTTAYFIMEKIKTISDNIKVTRLAFGIPVGGELDYLDEGTLHAALKSRQLI